MMKKIILGLIALVILCSASQLCADQTSDIYFHRGIQKYLKKNYDGAIEDVEKAVNLGATEKKVSAFLLKMLIEKGKILYNNKQYQDALVYFEKARKYDPENRVVIEVIATINEKLAPIVQQTVVSEKMNDAVTMELIKIAQGNQDKLIEAITKPNEIIRQILNKSDAERRDLITMLDKKNDSIVAAVKSEKDTVKSMLVYGVIGFVVSLIFIVIVIYIVAVRTSIRRENMLLKQQEALLGVMMQQQVALSQGQSVLRLGTAALEGAQPGYITPRLMLNDANPRVRAKGIEIIEAQMVTDKEDPEVAEKVLESHLSDKNNRVRGNAVRALYKYKPAEALEAVKEMLDKGDKWMRISAAWVLGEFRGDEEAAAIALSTVKDTDKHFRRRLGMTLTNLLTAEKEQLSKETNMKIKRAIVDLGDDVPKECLLKVSQI